MKILPAEDLPSLEDPALNPAFPKAASSSLRAPPAVTNTWGAWTGFSETAQDSTL